MKNRVTEQTPPDVADNGEPQNPHKERLATLQKAQAQEQETLTRVEKTVEALTRNIHVRAGRIAELTLVLEAPDGS